MTPWAGHGLSDEKDAFNYHLSAMRQCIERAFGILTRRWSIFQRPLWCSAKKWALVATVCAKLHNFCLDCADLVPNTRYVKVGKVRREVTSACDVFLNDDNEEERLGPRPRLTNSSFW